MNNKTLSEIMNNIMNRGSEKWLSRSLREDAKSNVQSDVKGMLSQLTDRQQKAVMDKTDAAFGLGTTKGGRDRKRVHPADIDGEKLAKGLDAKAVTGAKMPVTYDADKDESGDVPRPEPSRLALSQSRGRMNSDVTQLMDFRHGGEKSNNSGRDDKRTDTAGRTDGVN